MKEVSQEAQLMNYFTKFKPLDFLGFAALVKVEPKDDFEEFVTELVVKFQSIDRKHRRELLKLARNVAKANDDLFKDEDNKELPNS